jgi:signal transduction histidine kinase
VALTRVLRHLLDNAVKFGPLNQVVRLRLEPVGRSVRVTISDHGPGLAPEDLERVFEVFYQADGSATRRAGGLGLGLALVKKLVEAHGGQVRVESEPGRGSSFWFELEAVA